MIDVLVRLPITKPVTSMTNDTFDIAIDLAKTPYVTSAGRGGRWHTRRELKLRDEREMWKRRRR